MENIIKILSDPTFWIFTVLFGILINIISDWIRPQIEKVVGKYREDIRIRNEQRQRDFESAITELLKNPSAVIELQLDILYNLLISILIPSLAIFLDDVLLGLSFRGDFYFLYFIRYFIESPFGTIVLMAIYLSSSIFFFVVLNTARKQRNLYNAYKKRRISP